MIRPLVSPRHPSSAWNAAQRLEARVDVVVGMVVVAGLERLAADDAQARAVRPAQRRDRLGQRDRLDDRRLEVELVVVGQAQRVGLVVDGDRLAGREVDRRAGTPRGSRGRAGSTAPAGSGCTRPRARSSRPASARTPRFVRVSRTVPVDRRGQDEVVGQVDAGRPGRRSARSAPTASASRPATFQTSGPSVGRAVMGGPAAPRPPPRRPSRRRPIVERRPPRGTRSARRSSSIAMPFLMLWSVLTTSPSRPTSTLDRVLVGAAADLVGVAGAPRR